MRVQAEMTRVCHGQDELLAHMREPKTVAQKAGRYYPLPITCALSQTALEECAMRMRPVCVYRLHVGSALFPLAGMLLKSIGAVTQNHPFAPYIDLILSDRLEPVEWFIKGDEYQAWGSEGL